MKRYSLLIILALALHVMLSGCAPREESGAQMDYDDTKKMVIDILETEDGKKALQEMMKSEDMKQALIMDQQTVSNTIQTTLISDEGAKFWQKVFEDPKFVESFAKSLRDEHEKVIKELMSDPEYQKLLIEIFQDPEMEKSMQTSLKSQEFRKHLQEVIQETLNSPLYKAKIQETLLKAAEETGKEEESAKEESKE